MSTNSVEDTTAKTVELKSVEPAEKKADPPPSMNLGAPALTSEVTKCNRQKKLNEHYRLILAFFVFASLMTVISTALYTNPGVYKLDEQTVQFLSEAFNAGVLLTIPFLLGAAGAITRLLMSSIRIVEQLHLVAGSSLMACFSWISIKSGVFLTLLAPHLSQSSVDIKSALSTPNSFYTMALVAILVGMFSTNLYLFIAQRVEQLSNQNSKK